MNSESLKSVVKLPMSRLSLKQEQNGDFIKA